jgi:catechol-2,3-dioxygenase
MEITTDNSPLGKIIRDIYEPEMGKMRLVHLRFGNQVGFEIFEFVGPKSEKGANNFEYWKIGVFHFSITNPNIEELVGRIVESGVRQRSKVWEVIHNIPYKIVFCEDPFGNIIEIYSHDYGQVWSSRS